MKYIVIIEIEQRGYILKGVRSKNEGIKYSDQIFEMAENYEINNLHKIIQHINYIDSYSIEGNEAFFSKSFYSSSNGHLSVHVVKANNLNLSIFKSERRNSSIAISFDQLEILVEKFPYLSVGSN